MLQFGCGCAGGGAGALAVVRGCAGGDAGALAWGAGMRWWGCGGALAGVPMEVVNNLVESFPGRCKRCVEKNGAPLTTKDPKKSHKKTPVL